MKIVLAYTQAVAYCVGMKNNTVTVQTIKNLKHQHKTSWLAFNSKLEGVLEVLGRRMSAESTAEKGRTVEVKWSTTEDITDHVTAADFVAAGFSAEEAEAMIFVL